MKLIHRRTSAEHQEGGYRLCTAQAFSALPRDEAIVSIRHQLSAIEDDVRAIGSGLPIPPYGRVDLVCEDREGSLLFASLCELLDARELASALARADWAREHGPLLARLFARQQSADAIRIWQLAERVAPEAEALLRRMEGARVEVFQCEHLGIGAERVIAVRRHWPAAQAAASPREESAPADISPARAEGAIGIAHEHAPQPQPILTPEEIEDFFGSPEESDQAPWRSCATPRGAPV